MDAVLLLNSKRFDEALVEARRSQTLEGFDQGSRLIEFLVAMEKNGIFCLIAMVGFLRGCRKSPLLHKKVHLPHVFPSL